MIDKSFGREVTRTPIDDLLHDRELVLIDRLVADARKKLVCGAHLVREPQNVDEQTPAIGADRDNPLAGTDYHLSDRCRSALLQRLADHPIALLGNAPVGYEIVGITDVSRVEPSGVDEFGNLDRVGGFEPQLF